MTQETSYGPTVVTVACSHAQECEITQDALDQFMHHGTLSDGIIHKATGEACDATTFHIVRDHDGDRSNAAGWLVDHRLSGDAARVREVASLAGTLPRRAPGASFEGNPAS